MIEGLFDRRRRRSFLRDIAFDRKCFAAGGNDVFDHLRGGLLTGIVIHADPDPRLGQAAGDDGAYPARRTRDQGYLPV